MQKTYWWRVNLVVLPVVYMVLAYLGPCNLKLGRCLGGDSILLTRTFFHLSLSLLAVSPFLFFVSDVIFLKWLRFAALWFLAAALFILLAPVYSGGFMGMGATKESVSLWMGGLFVVVSLSKLVWDARQSKKGN